jgi:hypothetical protein
MAIYRGSGGSVEGITEADILTIAISQGGTGATTAAGARTNLGLGTAATTNASAYATAAQGTLADSAVQPEDIGTAAAQNVGYFATAAQGTLADSAVQPEDLADVATSGDYDDLSNKPTIPTNLDSLTDVVITSATTGQGLQFNGTNWVNSSAGSGTVTSVAMSVPTGLSVSGSPVTTSGTLAVTYTSGYAIPTTAKQTEWDTAYGWGNHASGGYLTTSTAASTYAPLTGTGASGTWGIDISGNAATATNVAYSGLTGTVPTWNQNTTGSAATLTTARTIAITGDLAYTSSGFDGSGNVTGTGTLATVNSNVGSYGSSTAIPVVTVNAKGLVTAVSTATVAGGQYFGSAATKAIAYNSQSIAENVTVTAGNSGLSAGPITISSGYTVTVESGSRWVIV